LGLKEEYKIFKENILNEEFQTTKMMEENVLGSLRLVKYEKKKPHE
jgi:hypothetical protein